MLCTVSMIICKKKNGNTFVNKKIRSNLKQERKLAEITQLVE